MPSSRLALWEADLRSGVVQLSPQWNRMRGGEPREARTTLGELLALVPPEEAPALSAEMRRVLKGEVAHYDLEHRVCALDGRWIWIRSTGEVAERDAHGRALRVVGTNALITERKEKELATQRDALRDALTGLCNRRYLDEALPREIARAQRNDTRLALLIADADHFKRVNDSFGHEAGDAVLRALGALLQQSIRRSDIACRYGGEEFVLVLPEVSAEGAQAKAEQLRAASRALALEHRGRPLGTITLSLGVALFPDHAADAEGLLRAADTALYQAKTSGRDRVCVAAPHAPAA